MSESRAPAVPHKLFQVGQKALIDRDGQVLVVYRHGGWLDFPGGRIDEGETDIVEALKREVREEASLEIEVGRPFATLLNREQTIFLVGYRCRYLSGEVTLSDEHVSFQWVTRDNYSELDDGSTAYGMLCAYFET